ncbi:hypothetical protein [Vibrio bivalvicida]|uniref:Uncharacterized protein n=1 Tax=Vibrio bivalvicida TaxID=1276888 RepID=A0A177Y5Q6_9VIBR|nr:hypothetical protein [Vibrio bivalvicida]OAJ96182.1 hypothetical protein APB76_01360 [Vibrio bivalvicida]
MVKYILGKYDYLVVSLFVLWPIINNEYPLWDGTILVNAIDNNDFNLISSMFNETGSPITTFFNYIVYCLSKIVGIKAHFVYSLLTSLFIVLIYSFYLKCIETVFAKRPQYSVIYAVMFSCLTFWPIFRSEIMYNYAYAFFFMMLSLYFFLNKRLFLSFVVLLISSDLQISFLVHLFLFSVFFLINDDFFAKFYPKKIVFSYYFLFLLVFGVYSYLTPSSGDYEVYNEISIKSFLKFFIDVNIYIKLAFFVPVLIVFSLSKKRARYICSFFICVGLIGVFYLAGKVNYFGLTVYPWFSRFDIPSHFVLLVICSVFLVDEENKIMKYGVFFGFMLAMLPNRIILEHSLSEEINKIERFYLSSPELDKRWSYSADLDGGSFYEKNYHLNVRYPDVDIISSDSFNYQSYCGDTIYSRLYMCKIDQEKHYLSVEIDN